MSFLWATPAFCGTGGEASELIAQWLGNPVGRFALEETSEGAALLKHLKARPGDLAEVESRLERVKRRLDDELVRGTAIARGEFAETVLRRLVREELTIGTRGNGITFVAAKPADPFMAAEEIFMNGAGREVARPDEVFANLSLKADSIRLGLDDYRAAAARMSSYEREMWATQMLETYSEALDELERAISIDAWENRLAAAAGARAKPAPVADGAVGKSARALDSQRALIERDFAELAMLHASSLPADAMATLASLDRRARELIARLPPTRR
jgi:hypothetical protein